MLIFKAIIELEISITDVLNGEYSLHFDTFDALHIDVRIISTIRIWKVWNLV